MASHHLIEGTQHKDERGILNFFNHFKMDEIVRVYEICPASVEVIRAWQGHQKEKKWFYCNSGAFIVNLIKIDNFEAPSEDIHPEEIYLNAKVPLVLEISGGYATGFKAVEENSRLLVFSNFSLDESLHDDFRYPLDTWKANWKNLRN